MRGGPAQTDTWDMKPEARVEYRGEFRPISTNVPGIQICENFPRLARHCDKLAIVRSVHHPDVNHTTATHFLLTGRDMPNRQGPVTDDWPHIGSVLGMLGRGTGGLTASGARRPKTGTDVPRFVEDSRGRGSGWLGPAFQPFIDLKDRLMPPRTRPSAPCWKTWSSAGCSMLRSSSGPASSAAGHLQRNAD